MVDIWRHWDDELRRCGAPEVAAQALADAELLALLASEGESRQAEKRALRHEAYVRMQAGRSAPSQHPNAEPTLSAMERPDAFSRLPSRADARDAP